MYIGVAADLTLGSGTLTADLDGTIHASDGRVIGTSAIAGGGDATASVFAPRMLAGAQLNLWKLRFYLQVNASTTPAASLGFGIRGVL